FYEGWKMTLVVCCLIPIVLITSSVLNKFSAIFMKRSLNHYSDAGTIAEEAISTIRTVVAFGSQKKLSTIYDSHLKSAKKEGVKRSLLDGLFLGVTSMTTYAIYALAFWYGSTLILSAEMTPGTVVNVLFAVLVGSLSLICITPDLQIFSSAASAGAKIFETIDRIPSIDIDSNSGDTPENVIGHIQLQNVSFIYPSRPEVKILNNISLNIEPGTTVALVGSSGSGKSTIISILLRFYDTISGQVLLDDQDINSLNLVWLRRQIGLVGQEPVLFNTTVAGNVALGLTGSVYENIDDAKKREMIENACKMANAHDFIMNLPDKYETNVGERGFLLSGGQKQRIAIARAIIKDPKILLLDEATSALDAQSEDVVQDALNNASKGRTTIVIAHRLSTIRNANKIVVLERGIIVEMGTHDQLMTKKGAYFKLVDAQKLQRNMSIKRNMSVKRSFSIKRVFPIKRSLSIKRSASIKRDKDDLEAAEPDFDYTTWQLIKKITSINTGPELILIFIGLLSATINGAIYSVFAISFAHVLQAFSQTSDRLRHDVIFWSLILVVIAAGTMLTNIIQGVIFGISGERFSKRIRSKSFASILRQDIAFFDDKENSIGVLTSKLSLDATHVNGLSGATLGIILQIAATIIACIIVSFVVGWKMTLVCLCCVPLLIGSGALRIKLLARFQKKTKKAYEDSAKLACESVANIRTVASLTREEEICQIYHNLLEKPLRQGVKNAFWPSISFAFAHCTEFLTFALAFWYGSRLFMNGDYDLQRMFVIFAAIIFGSASSVRIFTYAPEIVKAKSAANSIINLIEKVPVIDSWSSNGKKINQIQGHIKFSDVHFHYPIHPHVPVLRGLNLEIKPGQYAALVGPSGCGKSTTINLLERFYQLTSGIIMIDGIDISTMNVNNLREHIALVSQEPPLYNMTIKENIIFGCRSEQIPTNEDIVRVCREANIHDFIIGLPEGYDTYVGGKGAQLSGGQKQRIAIARALIRNSKILLLDEATSALDPETEKVIQNSLDTAARGRTTLAIAHRLSTTQHADVIFVIKDGKVDEQGTHKQLLERKGIYYKMVQDQLLRNN
ncbi:8057_t:CDS:2, partial [Cetraspora pellucida]